MYIRSYSEADKYLGRKADRPLEGRATRLQRREGGTIAVRYQATDVVTYHPDGRITLESGGWRTPTTKARITEYTRARVYADRGVWYLTTADRAVRFEDGITVREDGQPIDPPPAAGVEADRRGLQRKLDRAVRAYIKGFAAKVAAGDLERPGSGDCWGCLFQPVDQPEPAARNGYRRPPTATPHGRIEPLGIGHYLSHLGLEDPAEVYHVPSLLWNAIKARGYGDPGFIAGMIWGGRDRDGRMTAGILRAYFTRLKPALLAELEGRGQR